MLRAHDLEQRRLAGAVRADHDPPLVVFDPPRHVVEQPAGAADDGDLSQLDDCCHRAPRRVGWSEIPTYCTPPATCRPTLVGWLSCSTSRRPRAAPAGSTRGCAGRERRATPSITGLIGEQATSSSSCSATTVRGCPPPSCSASCGGRASPGPAPRCRVPDDPLGLGGPAAFNADALEAGEALVLHGCMTGLVPGRPVGRPVGEAAAASRRPTCRTSPRPTADLRAALTRGRRRARRPRRRLVEPGRRRRADEPAAAGRARRPHVVPVGRGSAHGCQRASRPAHRRARVRRRRRWCRVRVGGRAATDRAASAPAGVSRARSSRRARRWTGARFCAWAQWAPRHRPRPSSSR